MTITARKKKQRTTRAQAALAELQTHFPAAFPKDDADIRPLVISLRDDLRAWLGQHPQSNPAGIISAMQRHCSRETYQRTVIAGAMRINLQGEPVEPVTPEGQARAEQRLAQIQAEREATAQRLAAQPPAKPAIKKVSKAKAPTPTAAPAPPTKPSMPTVVVKKRRVIVKPD